MLNKAVKPKCILFSLTPTFSTPMLLCYFLQTFPYSFFPLFEEAGHVSMGFCLLPPFNYSLLCPTWKDYVGGHFLQCSLAFPTASPLFFILELPGFIFLSRRFPDGWSF